MCLGTHGERTNADGRIIANMAGCNVHRSKRRKFMFTGDNSTYVRAKLFPVFIRSQRIRYATQRTMKPERNIGLEKHYRRFIRVQARVRVILDEKRKNGYLPLSRKPAARIFQSQILRSGAQNTTEVALIGLPKREVSCSI